MENENDNQDVELEEVEEIEETDDTDWKAEALKAQAIAKRFKTKLAKAKEPQESKPEPKVEPKVEPVKTQESNELNSGDKALLVSYGVKGKDEIALAQAFMARTGEDIDTLIEDDIFQAKLSKLREARESAQAVPSGTKRSSASPKDSVEYHLEKYKRGEMQLSDMSFEMRGKVLDAAVEEENRPFQFS